MKERRPLELKRVIQGYNVMQVLMSSYIFVEACLAGWLTGYSWSKAALFYPSIRGPNLGKRVIKNSLSVCQDVDRSTDPNSSGMRMVTVSYIYFLSKFTEFADTFFFLARKKFEHVSLLQVTNKHNFIVHQASNQLPTLAGDSSRHHATLWMGVGALASGRPWNFWRHRQLPRPRIHVLLLLPRLIGTPHAKVFDLEKVPHYLSDGPGENISAELYSDALQWKYYYFAYFFQFVIVFMKSLVVILGIVECGYPWQFSLISTTIMTLFFGLFLQFYRKAYTGKGKAKVKKSN